MLQLLMAFNSIDAAVAVSVTRRFPVGPAAAAARDSEGTRTNERGAETRKRSISHLLP